jgi:hypothetical protein
LIISAFNIQCECTFLSNKLLKVIIAFCVDLFFRNPYELGSNSASTTGSDAKWYNAWTDLFNNVGIPKPLVSPLFPLGIYTLLKGLASYFYGFLTIFPRSLIAFI